MLTIVDLAEEQNLSAVSALEEGMSKTRNISVYRDDTHRRAFLLLVVIYKTVFNSVATERLRGTLRDQIVQLEEHKEAEIAPETFNTIYSMIDDLSFGNTAIPRKGNRTTRRIINEQVESNIDRNTLSLFEEIVNQALTEVNSEMIEELDYFFTTADNLLSEEPNEEEWKETFYQLCKLIGKLDKEGRYLGDVS